MNMKPVVFVVMFTALFGSSSVSEADEASKAQSRKFLNRILKAAGAGEDPKPPKENKFYSELRRKKTPVGVFDNRWYPDGNRDFPIQTYQGVPTTAAIYKKIHGKPASYLGRVFPGYKLHKDGYFSFVNFQTAALLEDGSWELRESVQYSITEKGPQKGTVRISGFHKDIYKPD